MYLQVKLIGKTVMMGQGPVQSYHISTLVYHVCTCRMMDPTNSTSYPCCYLFQLSVLVSIV